MRPKNQHYVPQSYLKLFSRDKKNIWVYDKLDRVIRSQNIKGTASITNFYKTPQHFHPLDTDPVSQMEGEAISLIKELDEGRPLDPRGLGKLANFIALQYLRTPVAKDRTESTFIVFWEELRKRYGKSGFSKQKIEKIAQSYIEHEKTPYSDVQDFLKSESLPVPPEELFVDTIIQHGFRIAEILSKQSWKFLYSSPDIWITSDNPFSVFREAERGVFPSLVADSTKTIPLSEKVLLAMHKEGLRVLSRQMLPWAVHLINLGTAQVAKRYVYSGKKELMERIAADLPAFEKDPSVFCPIR